jgi:hypothetical protein
MTNRVRDSTFLVLVVLLIVTRHTLGGPSLLKPEIICEVLILLIIPAYWLVPERFKTTLWYLIFCAINVSVALFTWVMASRSLGLVKALVYPGVFALLAAHAGIRAAKEALRIRKGARL